MELSAGTPDRYKKITFWKQAIDELLVTVFLEAHAEVPEEIVLDIDTTDVALHGKQEGHFFHGYYDHYCYLPLYVFSGEHLLCVRLRPANIDASAGSLTEIRRMVEKIRQCWPQVRITLRGDSGFCRDELMSWCEDNGVNYVFGFARNQRLGTMIAKSSGGGCWAMGADSETGASFCRVSLSNHDRFLEPSAACGGQGGTLSTAKRIRAMW